MKKIIRDKVLNLLNKKLNLLVDSALEAKEAATNEQSKAENKYDTRGLEASYLAGAQALRVSKLKEEIYNIEQVNIEVNHNIIKVGSLIELKVDDNKKSLVFLLPGAAGEEFEFENKKFIVVTPSSPLGSKLIGKKSSDSFTLKLKNTIYEYEILSIS